jgi:hypothetical protein
MNGRHNWRNTPLVVDDQYYVFSVVFFSARISRASLLNGRVMTLSERRELLLRNRDGGKEGWP